MTASRAVLLGYTSAKDPFFSSVVQLAHFDGTNGSTTFTNSCPRGNTLDKGSSGATLSTSQSVFGSASLRLASVAAQFARGASHADYNFSTNDWCIEFFTRPDTLALDFNSSKIYFDMRNSSLTSAWVPTISAPAADGSLQMVANGAQRIVAPAATITAAAWNYIALARVSGTTRLFVGVPGGTATQVGSSFTDANTYVQNQMTVGCGGNNAGGCLGYFDELRVTNGAGRYTSSFPVPASPFPNQ